LTGVQRRRVASTESGGPVRVGLVLKEIITARGWGPRLEEQVALGAWAQAVGAMAAGHAEAVALRAGILHVVVDSGAWATQLSFLQGELLDRLRAHGAQGIRGVRMRVGSLSRVQDGLASAEDPLSSEIGRASIGPQ
jgi:predicted nucleic acid-binding Zn ribbon protein